MIIDDTSQAGGFSPEEKHTRYNYRIGREESLRYHQATSEGGVNLYMRRVPLHSVLRDILEETPEKSIMDTLGNGNHNVHMSSALTSCRYDHFLCSPYTIDHSSPHPHTPLHPVLLCLSSILTRTNTHTHTYDSSRCFGH